MFTREQRNVLVWTRHTKTRNEKKKKKIEIKNVVLCCVDLVTNATFCPSIEPTPCQTQ